MSGRAPLEVLELIDDAAIGGGQFHVLLLARYLDPERFRTSIACAPDGWLVEEARRFGIPHYPVTIANALRWGSLREMLALLREHRFDIVHSHGGTAGFWGRVGIALSGRSSGAPPAAIHTYHGIHYLGLGSSVPSWYRVIDKALCRRTDRIVCVCASDYAKAVGAGIADPARTVVIPYGIETEKFERLKRPAATAAGAAGPSGPFIFGNVGRLHAQKNQEALIEAFASAVHDGPELSRGAELWIIGEGELRPRLERTIAERGLGTSVRLLGERRDIPELLSRMGAFVLPSLWEGQPLALLEAMTSGLPVIASSVDGMADLLTDGENALLVGAHDVPALSRAMRRLVADPGLCLALGSAARRTVAEGYTAQGMARRMGELYVEIVTKLSLFTR